MTKTHNSKLQVVTYVLRALFFYGVLIQELFAGSYGRGPGTGVGQRGESEGTGQTLPEAGCPGQLHARF